MFTLGDTIVLTAGPVRFAPLKYFNVKPSPFPFGNAYTFALSLSQSPFGQSLFPKEVRLSINVLFTPSSFSV